MQNFLEELEKYQEAQTEEINSRCKTLDKELHDAQQIIADIDMLQQVPLSVASGCRMIDRCEDFFKNCIDISQYNENFSFLDFVPAGRLYVRSEHLGYLRLCDMMPEDVELRPMTSDKAICNLEFTVLVKTKSSSCGSVEPYLDARVMDGDDCPVPSKLVKNKNGHFCVSFMPTKPGMHRLYVRLFRNPVTASPLDIPVMMNEVALPSHVSDIRASNVRHASSLYVPNISSPCSPSISVDCPADSPSNMSSVKYVVPCTGSFNNDEYFAALSGSGQTVPGKVRSGVDHGNSYVKKDVADYHPNIDDDNFVAALSPHSILESSPGSASTGAKAVPMKQAKNNTFDRGDSSIRKHNAPGHESFDDFLSFKPEVRSLPSSTGRKSVPVKQTNNSAVQAGGFDCGDCEEINSSMQRMRIDFVSFAGNGEGSCSDLESVTNEVQVDDSAVSTHSALPGYVSGGVEFEDLTYESDEDFDSSGTT